MPFTVGLPSALAVFLAADFPSQLITACLVLATVVLLTALRRMGEPNEAKDLPLFHDIGDISLTWGVGTSIAANGASVIF